MQLFVWFVFVDGDDNDESDSITRCQSKMDINLGNCFGVLGSHNPVQFDIRRHEIFNFT